MSTAPTIVHLDEQQSISEFMAARLTIAAIQHILFLKNQVPLPVPQLGRLPILPNSKSFKKRVELLDAVDTLSCHLHSTFSALSSSLAINPLRYPHKCGRAQVHLLVLLGPSLFGPRSRILLTIDGLTIQAWTESDVLAQPNDENQHSKGNTGSRTNRAHGQDQVRLPLSSILPPTTNLVHENDSTCPKQTETHSNLPKSPDSSPPDETLASYLGEKQALSAAERFLSRSLTMACAEDGATLSTELGADYSDTIELDADLKLEPTQTHVLIQAPRRFCHPSWIPRQNMSPGLDSILAGTPCHEGMVKKGRVGIRTDEIVIRCGHANVSTATVDDLEHIEGDDLIWWSWDGKIVGLSDL